MVASCWSGPLELYRVGDVSERVCPRRSIITRAPDATEGQGASRSTRRAVPVHSAGARGAVDGVKGVARIAKHGEAEPKGARVDYATGLALIDSRVTATRRRAAV